MQKTEQLQDRRGQLSSQKKPGFQKTPQKYRSLKKIYLQQTKDPTNPGWETKGDLIREQKQAQHILAH